MADTSTARSLIFTTDRAPGPSKSTNLTPVPAPPSETRPIAIGQSIPTPQVERIAPPASTVSRGDASLIYEPDPAAIARMLPALKAAPLDSALDARLVAILQAPLGPGESAAVGFAHKERELGNAFAQLTVQEARTLHARLSKTNPDDELANRFARLAVDRRNRLLTFLADARRREALASARR